MANWQRKLRLTPEWGQAQEHEITIQQLAEVVAKRLRALRPFGDELSDINERRDEIADEFEYIAQATDAATSDLDNAMQELYDWGDTILDGEWPTKKVCWVDTLTTSSASAA